ncbi:MAG TPA: ABC transporter permease [Gemmataceae bacterium]|nr:ABC transporter permease [Gemmataceae bacterium]
MNWIAWKMLTGDRAKYIGIVAGVTFAALLIAQQVSIALGLLLRTTSTIQDIADVDVFVMDPDVEYIDDLKPLTDNDLYRVQGVAGVAWAVPFYKGQGRLKLDVGRRDGPGLYQQVIVLGLDDATLVGAPREMVLGSLAALREPDAVVMDVAGFQYLWPGEPLESALGRVLEMNDHRAVIVGLCKASDTFMTFPILYTRYHQALQFVPQERRVMSAVLVGAEEGVSPEEVCRRIEERAGKASGGGRALKALTRNGFKRTTIDYFMKNTGILLNFSITTALGFVVGCAIAGQTFYTFTVENLNQFGALKAMGVTNRRIVGMVLFQALVVGLLGFGIGAGLAALFGEVVPRFTRLAFFMHWTILAGTLVAVLLIVALASLLSIRKVLVLEPAVVFRG